MQVPVDLGNIVGLQDPVSRALGVNLWKQLARIVIVYRSVDYDMTDVQSARTEFPGHTFCEGAQCLLATGERRKAFAATPAWTSSPYASTPPAHVNSAAYTGVSRATRTTSAIGATNSTDLKDYSVA